MVLVVKNLPANARDTGSIPGSGRSSEERDGIPLQYSCLENPMDIGTWRATVHVVTESLRQLNRWACTLTPGWKPLESLIGKIVWNLGLCNQHFISFHPQSWNPWISSCSLIIIVMFLPSHHLNTGHFWNIKIFSTFFKLAQWVPFFYFSPSNVYWGLV